MTVPAHRRNRRLVHLIGLLKAGGGISAPRFRSWLRQHGRESVCLKTIHRDIEYLRGELHAPIDYDHVRKTYVLSDLEWAFPYVALEGDELFAAILGESLVKKVMPLPLRSSIDSAMRVQLAAGEPENLDPQLFSSIAIATSSKLAADSDETFQVVSQAWRETRRLRLRYQTTTARSRRTRTVDVHALFLADGAWYARVFCHLRRDYRSLALHRISEPELLAEYFTRSEKIVDEIQSGQVFDYEMVKDVTVICGPEKAAVIAEREWFPGQLIEQRADGSLRLSIPEAPRPVLLRWVLSYAGALTVVSPREAAEEIAAAARRILENHRLPEKKSIKP